MRNEDYPQNSQNSALDVERVNNRPAEPVYPPGYNDDVPELEGPDFYQQGIDP